MAASGLPVRAYPYYDGATGRVCFDRIMGALDAAREGDFVLLHACCHNPTGADLDAGQWAELGELLAARRLVPFVDMAYLGLGDALVPDGEGTRILAGQVPEMMVAVSCSKNFGLYRDRTGCAIVVAEDAAAARLAGSQMAHIVRSGHSMPPDHGAAVVRTILEDDHLRVEWEAELDGMRQRLDGLRRAFAAALQQGDTVVSGATLARQRGLFSLLPLHADQVDRLRREHAIYMTPDGRINIAGLRMDQLDRIVGAIIDVCGRR